MTSWGAHTKNIRQNIRPFPEWKFNQDFVQNQMNKYIILNNVLNSHDKNIIKQKYHFDVEYYKQFNTDLINLNENQLYNNFLYYDLLKIKPNNKYDYIVNDNLEIDETSVIINKNMIYDVIPIRHIKLYSDLVEFRNTHKKHIIYNNETLLYIYNDLDLEFYRNTYLNGNKSITNFNIYLDYYRNKNNNRNNKQLIVIYTPPYDVHCGGIVVMHNLCKIINKTFSKTHKAKLFLYNNLQYKNPFCNDFASLDEINDNTIVIYPEIVYGNPLNAKNVVRWILLELGIEMAQDHYKNWNKTDLVYFWETSRINIKKLVCPVRNAIFKNNKLKNREGSCYLIKKGRLIHKQINIPENSICIDKLPLEEVNKIFNQSKYFYSYDPKSFFIIYAAMCGCIPIVYGINNISEEEYFKSIICNVNDIIFNKGIIYVNSDKDDTLDSKLHETSKIINECEDYYINFFDMFVFTVKYFIEDMNNYIVNNMMLSNTVDNTFYK